MPDKYRGPNMLDADVQVALGVLGRLLTVTATACDSHSVLKVKGFGTPDTLKASAVYLVGAISQ